MSTDHPEISIDIGDGLSLSLDISGQPDISVETEEAIIGIEYSTEVGLAIEMPEAASIVLDIGTVAHGGVSDYEGPYELTPSESIQTLSTTGMRMTSDVVVNPIPSNYGRVTYNGAWLAIS